jgi:hypothetical protein
MASILTLQLRPPLVPIPSHIMAEVQQLITTDGLLSCDAAIFAIIAIGARQ